jgi:hypothetical protein
MWGWDPETIAIGPLKQMSAIHNRLNVCNPAAAPVMPFPEFAKTLWSLSSSIRRSSKTPLPNQQVGGLVDTGSRRQRM